MIHQAAQLSRADPGVSRAFLFHLTPPGIRYTDSDCWVIRRVAGPAANYKLYTVLVKASQSDGGG